MNFINGLGGLKDQLKTLRRLIYSKAYHASGQANADQETIDRFHRLYYDSAVMGLTWNDTKWMGTPVLKYTGDLWLYQEILYDLKPDLVIETGTAAGGSAAYMASLMDLIGKGKIVSIDIEARADRPRHPRITYITGSSTAPEIVNRVRELARGVPAVMVILDSDHSAAHVSEELQRYKEFVTRGSYVVVEDSNINGHPVAPESGPGPMEAIDDFLKNEKEFTFDETKKKFLLSFNPRGYLKRK